MKIYDYAHYNDYGHEWYFKLLSSYPNFALIDMVVQWDEFPATEIFPFFIFSIGSHSLCGFSVRYKWFQISMDFIQTQPRYRYRSTPKELAHHPTRRGGFALY